MEIIRLEDILPSSRFGSARLDVFYIRGRKYLDFTWILLDLKLANSVCDQSATRTHLVFGPRGCVNKLAVFGLKGYGG